MMLKDYKQRKTLKKQHISIPDWVSCLRDGREKLFHLSGGLWFHNQSM